MLNVILLVFGAIMLFAGWQSFREQRQLLKKGVRTTARVVEITEFRARNGQLNYKPVWAFQDAAGKEYRLPLSGNHEQSTLRSSYQIGDTMEVVYDPGSPDRVYGVGAKQNFGFVLYLVVSVGLIAYVVADTIGLMS